MRLKLQEMGVWWCFVHPDTEAVHTVSLNGRRYRACYDMTTPGITYTPTHTCMRTALNTQMYTQCFGVNCHQQRQLNESRKKY